MKSRNQKLSLRLLVLSSYVNNLGWGIYAPLYALYVLKLGGSTFDVSLLWSIYAFIAGLLMMVFGKLENGKRYNPTKMLVLGYGMFIAVAFGLLFAKTIQHFYLVQFTLAVAMGILTPAARITYARSQSKGNEAGEWGLFDGGNYMLIAAASLLGGALYRVGGFELIFIAMICIQTLATVLALQNHKTVKLK